MEYMIMGFLPKNSGYLFFSRGLSELVDTHTSALRSEIESLDANRLLNTAPADLANYFVQKFTIQPLSLRHEEMHATERETQIDVRDDPRRYIRDKSRAALVPGQRIEVRIPFDGERELFFAQARNFTTNPPQAVVDGQELSFAFEIPHDVDAGDLKGRVDRRVIEIERHIEWGNTQINEMNSTLPQVAAQAIEARRGRLLANQGRIAALGIPVRARPKEQLTYAVPDVRRKAVPTLPPASSQPFKPEPIWAMEHYEHALTVMQNMTLVMERSPSSFSTMAEEDLRQHFLVQLNGHFEGRVTGETFNHEGKTDILLREGERNVFIAECKFWKGPKAFGQTIDQLLGYTAWRDSKTAILVFNRGTETSTVLRGVDEVARAHPNFKRAERWEHESGFRYVFHQRDDKNREFILTVLVFHVPG